jgi:hypothetical protein
MSPFLSPLSSRKVAEGIDPQAAKRGKSSAFIVEEVVEILVAALTAGTSKLATELIEAATSELVEQTIEIEVQQGARSLRVLIKGEEIADIPVEDVAKYLDVAADTAPEELAPRLKGRIKKEVGLASNPKRTGVRSRLGPGLAGEHSAPWKSATGDIEISKLPGPAGEILKRPLLPDELAALSRNFENIEFGLLKRRLPNGEDVY